MIKPPYNLKTVAIVLLLAVTAIFTALDAATYYAWHKEATQKEIAETTERIVNRIPGTYRYPLLLGFIDDTKERAKLEVSDSFVVEVTAYDQDGTIVASEVNSTFPKNLSEKDKQRHSIPIMDGEAVELENETKDSDEYEPYYIGKVELVLSTYKKDQENLAILANALAWRALFLLLVLVWLFAVMRRTVRRVSTIRRTMKALGEDSFIKIDSSSKIQEINDIIESVNELSDKLRGNDAFKKSIIAHLSHELKTPLGAAHAAIALLKRNLPNDNPVVTNQINICHDNMETIVDHVESLTDFKIVENGTFRFEPETFSIESVMDSVSGAYAARKPAGMAFSVTLTGAPPGLIVTDKKKLRAVLSNLLDNAIKYTEADTGSVELNWSASDSELLISVEDNGAGIDAEQIESVFKLGYRVNSGGDGLGLGLTRVKLFVELMGGTIELQSEPGEGTRAIVRIPIDTIDATETTLFNLDGIDRNLNALFVDDYLANCQIFSDTLAEYGITTTTFTDPTQALESIKEQQYDLIFVDYSMPQMNGLDFASQARTKQGQGTTIACVTAHSETSIIRKIEKSVRNETLNAWLSKPLKHNHLEEILRGASARKHTPETGKIVSITDRKKD